jgi:SET domain
MTTIPIKTFTGPLDPDGHSEWIVNGPTKAKVINAPGYPQPVPKPKASYGAQPAYVIKPTPDMGLGVFATRDIKMGELIFAERPLLVTPCAIMGTSENEYNLKTQKAILMMEWEKTLEIAVDRMEAEDKNAFMELANSHKDDGSGPILGITRTNGFRVGSNIFDGSEMREDGHNAYSGVIKIGSRINHRYCVLPLPFEIMIFLHMHISISCMPNVQIVFSTPSFSFQCSASVDIKAGEQLFYAYCEVDEPVAKRQAGLAPYGIVCSCPACTHATPETDKLRTEYRKIAKNYIVNGIWNKTTSSSGGRVAESAIEPVIRFKDALIREGFHFTSEYKAMILLLQNFYEGIGMKEKARPYKEEYKRYRLTSLDINH